MSTNLTAPAEAAREGARRGDGKFGNQVRSEASEVSLGDPNVEVPCGDCGDATKRSSGRCRRCDPAKKSKSKSGSSSSSRSRGGKRNSSYDYDAEPIDADEIGKCGYAFVPVFRGGQAVDGEFRECKNAVVKPAAECHRHGGSNETSLGRTLSKATAEAGRGECYPLAADHWESRDARLESLRGKVIDMLNTDTSEMARLAVAFRKSGRPSNVGRFSDSNQMLVITQHYLGAMGDGFDDDELMDEALRRTNQPHMTRAKWAEHGREQTEDGTSVVVTWWAPGGTTIDREPGESERDFAKRVKEEGGYRRASYGAHEQIPLSSTEGDDFEVAPEPLDAYRPAGDGDPEKLIGKLTDYAEQIGFDVEFTDTKPARGYAFWRAADSKIVVWDGIAGGDRKAVAHSMAHEMGHALLGHSTGDAAVTHRPDKEAAAESFASLMMADAGIDSKELSAHYIAGWKSGGHSMGDGANSLEAFNSAVEAYDDFVTATG